MEQPQKRPANTAVPSPPRILGIDPGSRVMGLALLCARKTTPYLPKDFHLQDMGTIDVTKEHDFLRRLGLLHNTLHQYLDECRPTVCVLEKTLVGRSATSAIKLGQARGALVAAIQRHGLPIVELAPTHIKKIVAGTGRATKEDVLASLRLMLRLPAGPIPHDASDALAMALTYGLSACALTTRHDGATRSLS